MSLENLNKWSYWILLVLGGLFLAQYWAQFFIKYFAGEAWSHRNYWNAEIGTYLLLAILVVSTPFYVYMAWKHYPRRQGQGR